MVAALPLLTNEGSALSVRNVNKVFQAADGSEVTALDCLSLTVAAGEMVSLIGPSGCGKSTLLRLIAGLIAPASGELRVGEELITGPSAERGLMFQDPNLFPWLSVRGNIQVGLVARGVLRRRRHEVEEVMRLVGLEAFANVYPHELSGGMAQRAALARALITRPKILLADEPTGDLDSQTAGVVFELIARLHSEHQLSSVIATHNFGFARGCHRVLRLENGRIEEVEPASLAE